MRGAGPDAAPQPQYPCTGPAGTRHQAGPCLPRCEAVLFCIFDILPPLSPVPTDLSQKAHSRAQPRAPHSPSAPSQPPVQCHSLWGRPVGLDARCQSAATHSHPALLPTSPPPHAGCATGDRAPAPGLGHPQSWRWTQVVGSLGLDVGKQLPGSSEGRGWFGPQRGHPEHRRGRVLCPHRDATLSLGPAGRRCPHWQP